MKIKFLFIVLLISGCASNHNLVGTWKAGSYSLLEKAHAMVMHRSLVLESTLELRPDSTWRLQGTCEIFEGNKWIEKQDSIFLYPDTCWGINNKSLNSSMSDFNGGYIAYKIRKHRLVKCSLGYYTEIDENDKLTKHKVNILEKLEPYK